MNRKITTAMYGHYNPDTTDKILWQLLGEYRKSEMCKTIMEEENKYFLEKWYFMRKFFEAEFLCEEILKVNEEFRLKSLAQKRKEYYVKNAEKIREQRRVNYSRNKEKTIESEKAYREKHREEINQRTRRYTEAHREQVRIPSNEKVTCECGCTVRRGHMAKHRRTDKHKLLQETQVIS